MGTSCLESPRSYYLLDDLDLLNSKLEKLEAWLQGLDGPVGLGFSGGVDSTFLLAACMRWCNGPVTAFVMVSPFLSARERAWFGRIAEEAGHKPVIVTWNPLEVEEIRRNGHNRCYFCKKHMYSLLMNKASGSEIETVLDGTQADDLWRDRPGLRALEELDIKIPLAWFGITKDEIRKLLKSWGFTSWNRPPESCLATKIRQNVEISKEKLKTIENLENFLYQTDFKSFKIELSAKEIDIFVDSYEIERIKMYFEEIKRIGEKSRFSSKIQIKLLPFL